MVTGSFSGRFLCSALKSSNDCASVMCLLIFPYGLVSAFGGSGLMVVLYRSWEYTFDGSLENRAFIFFASASLLYHVSLLASAGSLCLAVSRASGGDSPLYFPSCFSLFFIFTPFCSSTSWLTSRLVVFILATSFPGGVCSAFLFDCVAKHFQDYSGCGIYQFIGSGDGRS